MSPTAVKAKACNRETCHLPSLHMQSSDSGPEGRVGGLWGDSLGWSEILPEISVDLSKVTSALCTSVSLSEKWEDDFYLAGLL